MDVWIDGQKYTLQKNTKITRSPLIEFPQHIRTVGQQARQDRTLISSFVIEEWSEGLGIERMNINIARDTKSFWDVDSVDTRFPSMLIKSPLFIECTVPSFGQNVKYGEPCFDQVQFFFGGSAAHMSYIPPNTLGSTRWTKYATDGHTRMGNPIFTNDRLHYFATGTYYSDVICNLTSLDGTSTFVGLTSTNPDNTNCYAKPVIAGAGIIYDLKRVGTIRPGTVLVRQLISIPTNAAIIGTIPLHDNTKQTALTSVEGSPYHVETNGIYGATGDTYYEFGGLTDSESIITRYNNLMYVRNNYDLISFDVANYDTNVVGYNLDDGLPVPLNGKMTAYCPTTKWLYAAITGASYPHILAFDGVAWQYYTKVNVTGNDVVNAMFISNEPDSIERLWVITEAGKVGFYYNPLVNPAQAGTYAYVPTGHITFPQYDGGMSETPGGFFDLAFNVDNITNSETLRIKYGLNGAGVTSTLGIIATSPQTLLFGSPYGVEGNKIQLKMEFIGSQNASPYFRNAVAHYLKLPNTRETYTFTIDIDETTSGDLVRTKEQVIGSLNYLRNKKTLSPFWYGRMPTRAIMVTEMPSLEDYGNNVLPDMRSGIITARVSELI